MKKISVLFAQPRTKQWMWFFGLYAASLLALGITTYGLRLLIPNH